MTILRLSFAGQIKKADHKTAAGKPLVEVSICKKNRTKQDEKDAFTWVRIALWEPAEFQVGKLVKGAFIAGTGELTLRGYKDNDGAKAVSMEVSCRSFDVEVLSSEATQPTRPEPSSEKSSRQTTASTDDSSSEPPF